MKTLQPSPVKSTLVITAALLALGLSACSKNESTDTASAPASSADAMSPPVAPASTTDVTPATDSSSTSSTLSADASSAGDKIKAEASEAGDKIKAATSDTGDKVKAGTSEAGDKLKAATADASDKLKQNSDKAGAALSDAGLTAKVKSALAKDAGLSTLKLNVTSKDGAVTLTGTVDTAAHKDQIKSVATGVEGVKSVDDQTTVK